jgi:hypothetical protein
MESLMGNRKPVIEDFLTDCISLWFWAWVISLYRNCHVQLDHEKLASTSTIGIVSGLLILLFSPSDTYADMPMGGLQQRIGNYDVSIKTEPPQPQTGSTVKILMAIAAVNGDDISGIPIDITIRSDGSVLSGLNRPIAVPDGHHIYQYKFEKPGIYSLVLDIYDIYFTGREVSFTFPIEVKSTFFGLWGPFNMMGYTLVPIVIIVSTILALFIWQKHRIRLKDIPPDDKR